MDSLNFIEFNLIDLIDILLMAFLLYNVYKLVKGTVAINIFIGIVIVYLIWQLTAVLKMELLSNVFGKFIGVGVFGLIVVFHQEIRKFLLMLGSTNFASKRNFVRHFKFLKQDQLNTVVDVESVVNACKKMAKAKTGALIVFGRNNSLDFVKNTGDKMNIEITQPILESIFYKNSPLHDGAVIVEDNYIVATRVILPVSDERNIPQRYGLRHRAAIGITEKTDALALVVSEETGHISYIKNGEFVSFTDFDEMTTMIKRDLA
ncbi:diadenylate cyclase CdaA [Abyssalbus ytuae]|uniref:Diadenylate cyclase n=1 Tax=Abyssalbus ytuae TaxID=2926907 RepID=A0A9E6ZRI6_9FLAO|nr:diadenylate cyclase CdaA [Abyssalbus ytuae]UOB16558.1 diadenylate cyclase CdaA [Abyssalbus ytuae]